jgi:hypothetical protein
MSIKASQPAIQSAAFGLDGIWFISAAPFF